MIVMNLKVDNLCGFRSFSINFSYPKKVVHSSIPEEYLEGRPNFRYQKAIILMGTNASGKTSIGKIIMAIFNFLCRQDIPQMIALVGHKANPAYAQMDFVIKEMLYRIMIRIDPVFDENKKPVNSTISASLQKTDIGIRDNYEICSQRLDSENPDFITDYVKLQKEIPNFGWYFTYPEDGNENAIPISKKSSIFPEVLKEVLMTMDQAITNVRPLEHVDSTYLIQSSNLDDTIILKDGKILKADRQRLSSGTIHGFQVAAIMSALLEHQNGFYFCDELFSYTASDIEKACLSVMVQCLGKNEQLFFTTHNQEILTLPYPKHSFVFLSKEKVDQEVYAKPYKASDFLKKQSDSVKNAADNDLFSAAPDLNPIFDLEKLNQAENENE